MNKPFVSIICPTYNEEKYIANLIESILNQDFSRENMEFLILDGRSTDKTREIIRQYELKYPFLKLIDNPNKIATSALNIGLKQAKGDVIMRIDAHCSYPKNYISTLIKYLFELNADNVGAVLNTLSAKDTTECRAIAIASGHKFGVGNSSFRVGVNKIIETSTVPFGCFKREVFQRIGVFDENLPRAEDDEFNARIINHGGKIFLIPNITVNYYARDSFGKMRKMYYQYGLYKPLVMKKLGKPATLRQFFPLLFLLGLFVGAILSCFSKYILFLYFTILGIYLCMGIFVGIGKAKLYKDLKLIYYMPFTFFLIHLSYGWGYICGIWKILFKSKFSAEVTR